VIDAIAPHLQLLPKYRRRNPMFAPGERAQLALHIPREAGEPMPMPKITLRVLRLKGIHEPGKVLRRQTRSRLRAMFGMAGNRGVTV